jgi:hypothetical protein
MTATDSTGAAQLLSGTARFLRWLNALVPLWTFLLGVAATVVGSWLKRTWMPLVGVRLEGTDTPGGEAIRVCVEATNLSLAKVNKKEAILRIEPHPMPRPGRLHGDANQPQAELTEVMASTEKLEPKETVQTELLYRWGDAPAIRCVFSVRYESKLMLMHLRKEDQHSVARWFVRSNDVHRPSSEEAVEPAPGADASWGKEWTEA